MDELWKPIPGFDRIYEVSNLGSVRSIVQRGSNKPQLLKPWTYKGYKRVRLWNADGIGKYLGVHKLVLLAFVGPCPSNCEASHRNTNDRADNRLDNLAWETKKENNARKRLHGTAQIGEHHNQAKLKDDDVISIRNLHNSGTPKIQLASQFGVSRRMISYIVNRQNWTHI